MRHAALAGLDLIRGEEIFESFYQHRYSAKAINSKPNLNIALRKNMRFERRIKSMNSYTIANI